MLSPSFEGTRGQRSYVRKVLTRTLVGAEFYMHTVVNTVGHDRQLITSPGTYSSCRRCNDLRQNATQLKQFDCSPRMAYLNRELVLTTSVAAQNGSDVESCSTLSLMWLHAVFTASSTNEMWDIEPSFHQRRHAVGSINILHHSLQIGTVGCRRGIMRRFCL